MRTATRVLLIGLATAALLGAGYRWGATATMNKVEAGLLKQERDEKAQLLEEVKRGEVASGALQLDLRDLSIDYQQLQKAFHDFRSKRSLLARPHVLPRDGVHSAGAGGTGSTVPPAEPGETEGCVLVAAGAADAGVSAGAVWMWNSALHGQDTPFGACGFADQSEESCAVASGIGLDEVWANQALNAQLCAEDRLRHQHLIDFIKGRPR